MLSLLKYELTGHAPSTVQFEKAIAQHVGAGQTHRRSNKNARQRAIARTQVNARLMAVSCAHELAGIAEFERELIRELVRAASERWPMASISAGRPS
jgi:hypothetical protein